MSTTVELRLPNFIGGEWRRSSATEYAPVPNPATAELLAQAPLSPPDEVDAAVKAASTAFASWRRTPVTERVQYLFKLKQLLASHHEELAKSVTLECGKTLAESRAEIQRAIENVEVACGAPILLQGDFSEDISNGIDEFTLRQPLGVCTCICPFNFPGMIPFWFMPYAIASGNTYIVKPSERVPRTMQRIMELLRETGIPAGVANLVNGSRETVDALLDHPDVRAVSFVGSTSTAKHVYARGASNGKRVQCQGGAKNPIIILPDADLEMTTRIVVDSAFGCAGQRCLAASLVITVGQARGPFTEALVESARSRIVGNGLDERVQMGPVITPQSKMRIEEAIGQGVRDGAKVLVDGRGTRVPDLEKGNFIGPTLLDELDPDGNIARTEIFGPVLGLLHVETVDDAIRFVNGGRYGNMACLFTSSGANARKFRSEADVGNVGINIGVAAPMAFFPFSGARESFLGICMDRPGTRLSSSPKRKWLSNAGQKIGADDSSAWSSTTDKAVNSKVCILISLFVFISGMSLFAQERVVRLYQGVPPGSENWKQVEQESRTNLWQTRVVYNVASPTLTIFLPEPSKANGTALVICPGGAFHALSIDSEGFDVARPLVAKGVACFVLKYRLVECKTDDPTKEVMAKGNKLEGEVSPIIKLAMTDGLAAVGYVRQHAAEYRLESDRIGIMGFSAGGTLAASVAFNYSTETRPNFVAPIYLQYDWTIKRNGIPADAPPMFILAASDDLLGLAPHSVRLYNDWIAAKKSAELHLFSRGGHGFGMRKQNLPADHWIDRFTDWLDVQGLLRSK